MIAEITKKDIEDMQEKLRQAIMREDWDAGEKLVKQIAEAKEAIARQPKPKGMKPSK